MTILYFGDIIGRPGRNAIKKILPRLKTSYAPDLILGNCENLAHGKGITRETIQEMELAGIDYFTSGNHIFSLKQGQEILDRKDSHVLRPANYPPGIPGKGYKIFEVGTAKVAIINLIGRVFFQEDFDCPFRTANSILAEIAEQKVKIILVDFHAEASSESIALGWHLAGRVSLVVGTHTHVQTADERILPGGTAYITDIGMVGVKDSVIGVEKEIIIQSFLNQMPWQHQLAEGDCSVNAIVCEIDPASGKASRIERISEQVKL